MKLKIFHTPVLLCLLVLGAVFSAQAQGIGTVEYEMRYGREAYKAGKYAAATTYFESAIHLDPKHAEAHFLLGASYAKLKESDKARTNLEKAARLNPKYRAEVQEILDQMDGGGDEGEGADTESPDRNSADSGGGENSGEEIAAYEVGDAVEVFNAGRWIAGKVVAVEGSGKSVHVNVRYTFNDWERDEKFFHNAIRHAKPAKNNNSKTPGAAGGAGGGGLSLGSYGCSSKQWSNGQWVFTPRGSFRLAAGGKYTQTSGGGSYKYDAGTKTLTFAGGFFGNSGAVGKVESSDQIDIQFAESYWWTCARQ